MYVKPTPDRLIRDPVKGTFLPESGEEVPNDVFWQRRITDGDVVIVETPKPTKGDDAK